MNQALRVFIVDDNSLYRRFLTKATEATPYQTETETAPSGVIALKKIPLFKPDIVLLDIEMPDMNGIEVLQEIKKDYPRITAVLVSGVNSRSADITIEGLSSGASDFIPKPMGASPEENISALRDALSAVFAMTLKKQGARTNKSQLAQGAPAAAPKRTTRGPVLPAMLPTRVDVVGIGISTGGPTALEQILPLLPESMITPILIVQHMPPLFTESLANALNKKSKVTVLHAEDGMEVQKGCVYIAPGGQHMVVEKRTVAEQNRLFIRLDDGPPVNSCKPAVDVLFKSLAKHAGKHTLAIVMTGMGHDGLAGVQEIKNQGGYSLTQSEATCTVYGMPAAVDEAGLSDESVDLAQVPSRIISIAAGIAA